MAGSNRPPKGQDEVRIEGVTFDAGLDNAIEVEDAEYVRIADCVVNRTTSGSVWLVNCRRIEVVRTRFLGAGDPRYHVHDCLSLLGAGDLLIEECQFQGGDHGCILIRKARGGGTRVIRGNVFGRCDGSLLTIKEGYSGILIERNTFRGAATAAQSTAAATADHGKAVNHAAIQLSGDGHIVRGNLVEDCGKGFLISCSDTQTANGITLEANDFNRIAEHAIELQGYRAEYRGRMNGTRVVNNGFGQVGGDKIHEATPGGSWGTVIQGSRGLRGDTGAGSAPGGGGDNPPPTTGPRLESITPAQAAVGAEITLRGQGFRTDRGGVVVANLRQTVTAWTDTGVRARLTTGTPDGPTEVWVTLAGGQGRTNRLPFTVGSGAPPPPPPPPDTPSFAAEVLTLTNQERRKVAGRADLVLSAPLAAAAQKHADWMAQTGQLSHTGAGGSSVQQRIEAEAYRWQAHGENIAMGQRDPAEVVAAWMNSQGHRANILHAQYRDIGIGVARGADGRLWWCQVFGAPAGVPPPPPPGPQPVDSPVITAITPRLRRGEELVVRGEDFGEDAGGLTVGSLRQPVSVWTPGEVRATLLSLTPTGEAVSVFVRREGDQLRSNDVLVTVEGETLR